jgi:hypothetical protein
MYSGGLAETRDERAPARLRKASPDRETARSPGAFPAGAETTPPFEPDRKRRKPAPPPQVRPVGKARVSKKERIR